MVGSLARALCPSISLLSSEASLDSECAGRIRCNNSKLRTTDDGTVEELDLDVEAVCRNENVPRRRNQVIVAAIGFLAIFQTFGISQAYGVFQEHHTSNISKSAAMLPDGDARERAFIAAIGSVGGGTLSLLLGSVMTKAIERVPNMKWLTLPGAVIMSLGYMLAALSTRTWHLFLTQGLLSGIGASLFCYPIVTVTPEYFSRLQGLAMGIITAGSGLGGLLYAPVVKLLIEKTGIRKTFGILGLINLVSCCGAAALTQPRQVSTRQRGRMSWKLATNPKFVLNIIAALCTGLALGTPLSFGPEFSNAIGFRSSEAAWLLALNNGMAPLRILIGYAGDCFGRQNVLLGTVMLSFLCVLIFWLVPALIAAKWMWILFSVLYGTFGSGYSTLYSSEIIEVFGKELYLVVNGYISVARGIGSLAGPPLAGVIMGQACVQEARPKEFIGMTILVALLLAIGSVALAAIRYLDARDSGWKRVR